MKKKMKGRAKKSSGAGFMSTLESAIGGLFKKSKNRDSYAEEECRRAAPKKYKSEKQFIEEDYDDEMEEAFIKESAMISRSKETEKKSKVSFWITYFSRPRAS